MCTVWYPEKRLKKVRSSKKLLPIPSLCLIQWLLNGCSFWYLKYIWNSAFSTDFLFPAFSRPARPYLVGHARTLLYPCMHDDARALLSKTGLNVRIRTNTFKILTFRYFLVHVIAQVWTEANWHACFSGANMINETSGNVMKCRNFQMSRFLLLRETQFYFTRPGSCLALAGIEEEYGAQATCVSVPCTLRSELVFWRP